MKKLFLFFIFLLVGCSSNKNIDINKLSSKLDEIEVDTLNIDKSLNYIERVILKKDLNEIDMSSFINLKNLEEYYFYASEDNYIFIVKSSFDPTNDINKYFSKVEEDNKKVDLTEKLNDKIEYRYSDYYIYIVSNFKNEILTSILDNKNMLFDNMYTLNSDEVMNKYGIYINNSIVKVKTKFDSNYEYIIVNNPTSEEESVLDKYYSSDLKIKNKNILIYTKPNNNKIKNIIEEELNF